MSRLLDRPIDVHLAAAPQLLEYDRIAERVAADAPGTVLDWGAGYGQMTRRLHRRGIDVTAFDYREDLDGPGVEQIADLPEVQTHVSPEPVRLPFEDDRFDAVL